MQSVLPILLFCSSLLTAVHAMNLTYCSSGANYTRGGAFQTNLGALLSSLPAEVAASSGFTENVTGAVPDQAYGLGQCRGDVNSSDCLACLDGLAQDMAAKCSGQKEAFFFYDKCLLRRSDTNFFGVVDTSVVFSARNQENVTTTPEQYTSQLGTLMGGLRQKAANTSRKFAAGSIAVTPLVSIYGMAQCIRDLSTYDCNRCLSDAVEHISDYCNRRKGCRVISWSCFIRFEDYQFADAAMTGGGSNGSDHSGSRTDGGNNHTVRIAIVVSIAVAVALLVLVLVAIYLCRRNRMPQDHVQQIPSAGDGDDEEMRSSVSLLYDLSTLRAVTNNFSEENKLGEGGFGRVYKGLLQNGLEIAVKRLSATSLQGKEEMKNEVVLLAKLQHKNLVRLLGCCTDEHERLLVYEFLSNNSLDKILFDPARQQELCWGQRQKIIEGVSRGLQYLHHESRLTIIHRDLKASNILLDANMNPKISDFGLAKLFNIDSSVRNTSRIAGTYGYMAPEYALHGIFSTKSDVFSYGVLVLEIITGRRSTNTTHSSGPSEDLLTYVWRHWSRGTVHLLLEAEGCPGEGQREEMQRCIHIGLLCVQEDPRHRPRMESVVVMLNSHSITLPPPAAPAFAVPGTWSGSALSTKS